MKPRAPENPAARRPVRLKLQQNGFLDGRRCATLGMTTTSNTDANELLTQTCKAARQLIVPNDFHGDAAALCSAPACRTAGWRTCRSWRSRSPGRSSASGTRSATATQNPRPYGRASRAGKPAGQRGSTAGNLAESKPARRRRSCRRTTETPTQTTQAATAATEKHETPIDGGIDRHGPAPGGNARSGKNTARNHRREGGRKGTARARTEPRRSITERVGTRGETTVQSRIFRPHHDKQPHQPPHAVHPRRHRRRGRARVPQPRDRNAARGRRRHLPAPAHHDGRAAGDGQRHERHHRPGRWSASWGARRHRRRLLPDHHGPGRHRRPDHGEPDPAGHRHGRPGDAGGDGGRRRGDSHRTGRHDARRHLPQLLWMLFTDNLPPPPPRRTCWH